MVSLLVVGMHLGGLFRVGLNSPKFFMGKCKGSRVPLLARGLVRLVGFLARTIELLAITDVEIASIFTTDFSANATNGV